MDNQYRLQKQKHNLSNRLAVSGIAALLVLLAIDQLTKLLSKYFLAPVKAVDLIPGVFQLYYLENRGAAFGMLSGRQELFIVIALVMIAFGTYVYYRAPVQRHYHLLRFVCVLLVAGALGNMLDRIFYQHVTDFFYLTLINFPVFNVADCYVCVGAFLAVISLFTIYREDEFEFLRKH